MKQRMLRSAGWKVRDKTQARAFATDLTADDVDRAVYDRSLGDRREYGLGHRFLHALDVVSASLPHSNEAAKKMRRNAETYQHHFGQGGIFLTVSPDDANSFLVQVYAGVILDPEEDVTQLPDKVLSARAKQRNELRLRFPGLTAYIFECLLDIVIEEVVGWDLRTNKPREDFDFYIAKPAAFIAAVEEQGRLTVHAHMQVWFESINEARESLHSPERLTRREGASYLTNIVNRVCSTELICNEDFTSAAVRKAFDHVCRVPTRERLPPTVVNDQQLRNLRHKEGQQSKNGMFAYCRHCTKYWTNVEFVESYL